MDMPAVLVQQVEAWKQTTEYKVYMKRQQVMARLDRLYARFSVANSVKIERLESELHQLEGRLS